MSQYTKQMPGKTYTSSWTEFEKRLIDFVREHPVIYDIKPDDEFTHVRAYNELWKDFANKWNYSAASCKRRWRMIRSSYLKLESKPKASNFVSLTSHKRLTDGRLSFLDHLHSPNFNTQHNNMGKSHGDSETSESQRFNDGNIIDMVLSEDEDSLQMTNITYTKTEQPLSKIVDSTIELLFKGTTKPTDDTAMKPLKTYSLLFKNQRATSNNNLRHAEQPLHQRLDEKVINIEPNNLDNVMLTDKQDPLKITYNVNINAEQLPCHKLETTSNDNSTEQSLRQRLDETVINYPNKSDSEMKILKSINEHSINEENINIETNDLDNVVLTDEQDPLKITNNDNFNADQTLCNELETIVSKSSKVIVTEIKILKPPDQQPIHKIQINTDSDSNKETSDYETQFTNKNDHTTKITHSQTSTVSDRIYEVMKVIKNRNSGFSNFETSLIQFAKEHPLLYETRDLQDDPARRNRVKFLWDTFAKAFYPYTEVKHAFTQTSGRCQKNWNRIRLEYFIVRKLVDDYKDIKLRPSLSKYIGGELSFLNEMYDFIKMNSIRILYKGTGSLEDNGYLEACSDSGSIPFDWLVISFVQKHRILYDKRPLFGKKASSTSARAREIRILWEELAVNLNTSRMDCEESWNKILINYLKVLRSMERTPNMKIPRRYNRLSFLNEIYGIKAEYANDTEGPSSSSFSNDKNKKRYVNKKNTLPSTFPILEELIEEEVRSQILREYSTQKLSEESNRKEVADAISTFEELMENQEELVPRNKDLLTHKTKTQSSTIIDQFNPKEIPVTSDTKNNKKTDIISILNEWTEEDAGSESLGMYSPQTVTEEPDRKEVAGAISTFKELIAKQEELEEWTEEDVGSESLEMYSTQTVTDEPDRKEVAGAISTFIELIDKQEELEEWTEEDVGSKSLEMYSTKTVMEEPDRKELAGAISTFEELMDKQEELKARGKNLVTYSKRRKITGAINTFEEFIDKQEELHAKRKNMVTYNKRQKIAGAISTFEGFLDKQEKIVARSKNLITNKNETLSSVIVDQSNTKENLVICGSKYNNITEEVKSDSIIDLSLENCNFFREIGKYITDNFPEKKQKEIQIKSWALVTQLELEMLEEV